jgi:hypothetical protein
VGYDSLADNHFYNKIISLNNDGAVNIVLWLIYYKVAILVLPGLHIN